MNCSFSYAKFGCVGLNRRDFFSSNIVTFSDYYPFGMVMSGRNGGENYRYAYQGSEVDNEVKGNGNSYTTFYRKLDPRLGRWLSIDPKSSKFPWQSPYISMDNNPIFHNDPLGDDVGYRKFGDKVRVGLARVFNKKARRDYRKRRDDVNTLHIYSHNSKEPLLKDAKSKHFIGGLYGSTNVIEYSTPGLHVPDWGIDIPDIEVSLTWKKFTTEEKEEYNLSLPRDGTEVSRNFSSKFKAVPNTEVKIDGYPYPDRVDIKDSNGASIFNGTVVTRGNYEGAAGINFWGSQKRDSGSGGTLNYTVFSSRRFDPKKANSNGFITYFRYRKIAIPKIKMQITR